MANKAYNFRLSPEVNAHLDFLCDVTGQTRTALISSWIETEYDRYQGNPELQKLIAQMKDMERQMKAMLGQPMTDTLEAVSDTVPALNLGSCSECVNPCKDDSQPDDIGLCDHFKPAN